MKQARWWFVVVVVVAVVVVLVLPAEGAMHPNNNNTTTKTDNNNYNNNNKQHSHRPFMMKLTDTDEQQQQQQQQQKKQRHHHHDHEEINPQFKSLLRRAKVGGKVHHQPTHQTTPNHIDEQDLNPDHERAYKAVHKAVNKTDHLDDVKPETKRDIHQYILDNMGVIKVPDQAPKMQDINDAIPEQVERISKQEKKCKVYQYGVKEGLIKTTNTTKKQRKLTQTGNQVERRVLERAAGVRDQVRQRSRDVAEGIQLMTVATSKSRACLSVSTGLEQYEQHLAFLTTGVAEEAVVELATETGILRLLLTPVVMVLMTPVVEKIKQKMSSGGVNPLIDLLADLVFAPLVLLISIATTNIIAKILPDQLLDSLTFRLTDFLASVLERDVGTNVSEDIVSYLAFLMRRLANPILATAISNFLISIIPQATVDACTTAVTEAVGTKTARLIQPQLTSYLQCMYCYEKGMYCKQCWWSADMSWMEKEWFLGGDSHVGAGDIDQGTN